MGWYVKKVIHGKKTSISVVKDWAVSLGGELLSTEYGNALSKLDWRCALGHEFKTTFNHVKNRGQWCPVCGREKAYRSLIIRMSTQEARDKISRGHLKRLDLLSKYTSKSQRKIASSIRDHVTGLIRNPKKHKSILPLLGCSIDEFRLHLESKFQPNMTWENRGFKGWHIDHIKPLADFDLTDSNQLESACHYTNLQPLWWRENLVKYCY